MADISDSFSPGGWSFTREVVDVFDQHVRQSVPFYDAIQDLIAELSDWLLPTGGLLADLGASTGTTAAVIIDRHPDRGIQLALYDEQEDMLAQAAERLGQRHVGPDRLDLNARRVDNGHPLAHFNADLTTALFTLQFLPLESREPTLAAARAASANSGALVVAEKIRPVDARWSEIATDVSHDWKQHHGISGDAIRAKARALRGVLIPSSFDALIGAIEHAGWHSPEVLFRWHQWVVVAAFAEPLGAHNG